MKGWRPEVATRIVAETNGSTADRYYTRFEDDDAKNDLGGCAKVVCDSLN